MSQPRDNREMENRAPSRRGGNSSGIKGIDTRTEVLVGSFAVFQLREKEMEYVFEELKWYVQKRQEQVERGGVTAAPIEVGVEGTQRCDGLVSGELTKRLVACVKRLKDVPDRLKDWHPGSNRQVLDQVHPSLFPFVAGRTRVTDKEAIPPPDFITAGKILDVAPVRKSNKVDSTFYSKTQQWLPTDFDISPDGRVKANRTSTARTP